MWDERGKLKFYYVTGINRFYFKIKKDKVLFKLEICP